MLRKFPFLSRFFSKLLYGFLPAAIVSVVGGMLCSHYARPSVVTTTAAIGTPGNAEMMQMVRDEHARIVNHLQEYTEARQQADLAAEQEMLRSKATEQAAILAAREETAAETKALAIAAHVAEKPKKMVAAKQPPRVLDKVVVGEPLQLIHMASAATQIQPVGQPTARPARLVTPAARSDENVIKTKFYEVTAMVERIPLWVHSASEWFSHDVLSHRMLQLRTGIS